MLGGGLLLLLFCNVCCVPLSHFAWLGLAWLSLAWLRSLCHSVVWLGILCLCISHLVFSLLHRSDFCWLHVMLYEWVFCWFYSYHQTVCTERDYVGSITFLFFLCLNISVLYLMYIIIAFLNCRIPNCLEMKNQHNSVACNLTYAFETQSLVYWEAQITCNY